MRNYRLLSILLVGLFVLTGCPKKPTGPITEVIPAAPEYDRQLPPGQLALRKITDLNQIPDFTVACQNTANLRKAIDYSLDYLAKPSSKQFFPYGEITREHAIASLKAFAALVDAKHAARPVQRRHPPAI